MNYRLAHIAALAKLILIPLGRTRSPSDLDDPHADLVEVVRHADDHDIVPSLRAHALKVDGPSVGLQHAALEPDYSGAPRE